MNIKKLVVEFGTVFAVALVTVARHNLRQEPSAVILHARICE